MIIVLTGAPGAGKGTQAALLTDRTDLVTLSTGDALRAQVKAKTEIGNKASAIMERGELVPDDVLLGILEAELSGLKGKTVLLDGYPRNVAQAETLDKLQDKYPVKSAIQLDVQRDELIQRLSGRRICSSCGQSYHIQYSPTKVDGKCDKCGSEVIQRKDDNAESVAVRLDVYEKNTRPVLDFYKEKGMLHVVEGVGSTEDIYNRLKTTIEGL